MHWSYGGPAWLAWLAVLAMVGFLGLVVWLLVSLSRSEQGEGLTNRPTPEQLLAERFAADEIDAEEYRSRLGTLRDTKEADR